MFIQEVGSRQRYLAGTYSLEFGTTPPVRVEGVRVGDKRIVPVTIPEPGLLNLDTGTGGYGGVFQRTENGLELVVPSSGEDPSGRFSLQPGRYVVMFRAKTRNPNRPLPHPLCGYSPRRKPHPRILIMLDFLTAPQSELDALDRKDTRSGFGQGLLEVGQAQENVVALCADLTGSLKMNAFQNAFPNRFKQAGIAEANMIGVAAGMTIGGLVPFTGTFANFSTGRVYDQIRQSVAYSDKNVKICASHCGLTLGEDGATHQILEDVE